MQLHRASRRVRHLMEVGIEEEAGMVSLLEMAGGKSSIGFPQRVLIDLKSLYETWRASLDLRDLMN